jgi:phosphosulfolactate phosphohydrolase-like enzyme
LAQNLKQVESDTAIDDAFEEIDPYLLRYVVSPYLHGKEVFIADLDFTEFSLDDIITAGEIISKLTESSGKIVQIAAEFRSMAPSAVKHKSFC